MRLTTTPTAPATSLCGQCAATVARWVVADVVHRPATVATAPCRGHRVVTKAAVHRGESQRGRRGEGRRDCSLCTSVRRLGCPFASMMMAFLHRHNGRCEAIHLRSKNDSFQTQKCSIITALQRAKNHSKIRFPVYRFPFSVFRHSTPTGAASLLIVDRHGLNVERLFTRCSVGWTPRAAPPSAPAVGVTAGAPTAGVTAGGVVSPRFSARWRRLRRAQHHQKTPTVTHNSIAPRP